MSGRTDLACTPAGIASSPEIAWNTRFGAAQHLLLRDFEKLISQVIFSPLCFWLAVPSAYPSFCLPLIWNVPQWCGEEEENQKEIDPEKHIKVAIQTRTVKQALRVIWVNCIAFIVLNHFIFTGLMGKSNFTCPLGVCQIQWSSLRL